MDRSGPDNATALEADAEHIRARVVWYYYVGGLTQQEIADKLGLTRLRVNKIIGQARSDGSVKIDIRLSLAQCVELEVRLKERFGLNDAHVIPAVPDPVEQQRLIGEAAGTTLDPLIEDGKVLGVGWGRTLSSAIKNLTQRRYTSASVATLMGSLTRAYGTAPLEVASGFAKKLGAECFYLAAPIYCPTSDSLQMLRTHYGIAEAMRRARSSDIAIISCGDLSERSQLATTQTVAENVSGLLAAGAVGDVLGVFLDSKGRVIDHPLNERVMALSPTELKEIPHTILASGGAHKVPIIRAILRAGLVKAIVTDEAAATLVLEQQD
jgi:DNA-binding transcriptional regulator LsrR (DeoR family)